MSARSVPPLSSPRSRSRSRRPQRRGTALVLAVVAVLSPVLLASGPASAEGPRDLDVIRVDVQDSRVHAFKVFVLGAGGTPNCMDAHAGLNPIHVGGARVRITAATSCARNTTITTLGSAISFGGEAWRLTSTGFSKLS